VVGQKQSGENTGLRGNRPVARKQVASQYARLAMPCAASAQPVLASHSAPSLTVFLCGGEGGIPSARSGSRTVSRRATCPGASIQRE